MKVHRIDHVGVNVNDLAAAKAFFVDLGLKVQAEWESEGPWLDRIVGLSGTKTACVALGTSDGQTWIELVQFIAPPDDKGVQPTSANMLGIRHLTLAVDDLEALVAKMKPKGMELFSEIQNYENKYKLCYCRGPEGIILELAERIG